MPIVTGFVSPTVFGTSLSIAAAVVVIGVVVETTPFGLVFTTFSVVTDFAGATVFGTSLSISAAVVVIGVVVETAALGLITTAFSIFTDRVLSAIHRPGTAYSTAVEVVDIIVVTGPTRVGHAHRRFGLALAIVTDFVRAAILGNTLSIPTSVVVIGVVVEATALGLITTAFGIVTDIVNAAIDCSAAAYSTTVEVVDIVVVAGPPDVRCAHVWLWLACTVVTHLVGAAIVRYSLSITTAVVKIRIVIRASSLGLISTAFGIVAHVVCPTISRDGARLSATVEMMHIPVVAGLPDLGDAILPLSDGQFEVEFGDVDVGVHHHEDHLSSGHLQL